MNLFFINSLFSLWKGREKSLFNDHSSIVPRDFRCVTSSCHEIVITEMFNKEYLLKSSAGSWAQECSTTPVADRFEWKAWSRCCHLERRADQSVLTLTVRHKLFILYEVQTSEVSWTGFSNSSNKDFGEISTKMLCFLTSLFNACIICFLFFLLLLLCFVCLAPSFSTTVLQNVAFTNLFYLFHSCLQKKWSKLSGNV